MLIINRVISYAHVVLLVLSLIGFVAQAPDSGASSSELPAVRQPPGLEEISLERPNQLVPCLAYGEGDSAWDETKEAQFIEYLYKDKSGARIGKLANRKLPKDKDNPVELGIIFEPSEDGAECTVCGISYFCSPDGARVQVKFQPETELLFQGMPVPFERVFPHSAGIYWPVYLDKQYKIIFPGIKEGKPDASDYTESFLSMSFADPYRPRLHRTFTPIPEIMLDLISDPSRLTKTLIPMKWQNFMSPNPSYPLTFGMAVYYGFDPDHNQNCLPFIWNKSMHKTLENSFFTFCKHTPGPRMVFGIQRLSEETLSKLGYCGQILRFITQVQNNQTMETVQQVKAMIILLLNEYILNEYIAENKAENENFSFDFSEHAEEQRKTDHHGTIPLPHRGQAYFILKFGDSQVGAYFIFYPNCYQAQFRFWHDPSSHDRDFFVISEKDIPYTEQVQALISEWILVLCPNDLRDLSMMPCFQRFISPVPTQSLMKILPDSPLIADSFPAAPALLEHRTNSLNTGSDFTIPDLQGNFNIVITFPYVHLLRPCYEFVQRILRSFGPG